MSTPRVALAGIFIESNAFSRPFDAQDFERALLMRGAEITTDARAVHPKIVKEMVGFVHGMDQSGDWEPVPLLFAGGTTGGPVVQQVFDALVTEIVQGLQQAGPLAAVYVCNHGALTATQDLDAEGSMLARIRAAVGPDTQIVGTLDLHANVSQVMVDAVDLYVAYRTDPHVDQHARGVELAQLLREILAGVQPAVANLCVPIVAPNVSLQTDDGPYGDLIRFGESRMGGAIMNVSIVAGFAFSDTPKNGLHVIVSARGDTQAASALCSEIAERAWADRARFDWNLLPLDQAVAMAVQAGEDPAQAPLYLVDLGDNAGAGAPANTLWMLEALHRAGARGALVANFFDPQLAAQAAALGVGAGFDATFRGDDWEREIDRFDAPVTVLAVHPGSCVGRRGINAGRALDAGLSCLLQVGEMMVSVNSRRTTLNDPVYVEMLGIAPGRFRTLVVKGRGSTYGVSWDEYFPPGRRVLVDTPGRTTPVLTRHTWKHLPRPSWPLDRDFDWHTSAATARSAAHHIHQREE